MLYHLGDKIVFPEVPIRLLTLSKFSIKVKEEAKRYSRDPPWHSFSSAMEFCYTLLTANKSQQSCSAREHCELQITDCA